MFDLENKYTDFMQYFNLPFAGRRDRSDASLIDFSRGFYWSSSPNNANNTTARRLTLETSTVKTADASGNFAYGCSIRCFKDSYGDSNTYTVTFNPNNGNEPTTAQVVENETLTVDQIPVQGVGWFTSEDGGQTLSDEPFDFYNAITGNITLYARWRYCPEYYSVCVEFSDTTETASII